MLSPLRTNASYSRSGTMFSRSLLVRETLSGATKAFFVFETAGEMDAAVPSLAYVLNSAVTGIRDESALLAAFEASERGDRHRRADFIEDVATAVCGGEAAEARVKSLRGRP